MAPLGRGGPLKDKITYNKRMLAYPSGVIVAKSLLVAGRLHHSSVPYLLEHVNVHLALFLGLLLIIEVDARGIIVEVSGDDHLSPIDEEERCVPHRAVHAHPQALEQGGELIHLAVSVDLELIVDTGFDPLED